MSTRLADDPFRIPFYGCPKCGFTQAGWYLAYEGIDVKPGLCPVCWLWAEWIPMIEIDGDAFPGDVPHSNRRTLLNAEHRKTLGIE